MKLLRYLAQGLVVNLILLGLVLIAYGLDPMGWEAGW